MALDELLKFLDDGDDDDRVTEATWKHSSDNIVDAYTQTVSPAAACHYPCELLDEAYRRALQVHGVRLQQLAESGAARADLSGHIGAMHGELADLWRRAEAAVNPARTGHGQIHSQRPKAGWAGAGQSGHRRLNERVAAQHARMRIAALHARYHRVGSRRDRICGHKHRPAKHGYPLRRAAIGAGAPIAGTRQFGVVTGQWSLLHVQVDRYTLRHEVHPLSVPSQVGADREDIVKEWLT